MRKKGNGNGTTSLTGAYGMGVVKALEFVGTHLVSATITALTFMFVYKYIVAKDSANQPPTLSGK